jgi:hypothetical protein
MKHSVLGIDMACSWKSLGSAILQFSNCEFTNCETGVLNSSGKICDPLSVATEINRIALSSGCSAVAIDGPHAWRDPYSNRPFVGRLCEKETRTPGKTGTFNTSYPGTWLRWINFSIEVFDYLLSTPHCTLANDPTIQDAKPPKYGYFLLECFPTSTWRSCGLAPLKGHRISRAEIIAHAEQLRTIYKLPKSCVINHHDHLQAIVSALPAAGLLGGPCTAVARGEQAKTCTVQGYPNHLVEGLIWDAVPIDGPLAQAQCIKMVKTSTCKPERKPATSSQIGGCSVN